MGGLLKSFAQRWSALGAALVLVMFGANVAQAERVALVVGNASYDTVTDLKNPVTDAGAIADALKKLDFKVTLLTDVENAQFWTDLDTFVASAVSAESAVFFYSGHAFQMSGVNYLLPVSAKLESRDSAIQESISLDAIIAKLQSRNRQTLIFLDACRNDPLPPAVRGVGAAADGLARVQTGVGTYVAFATGAGGVAADSIGDAPNSPFTTALLKHIGTEGISISDMMIEVRNDVETATGRKQAPWDQSSLREQFYFVAPQTVKSQELSEKDFELLAQLSPEDRKTFMALLAQSGFDGAALEKAEVEISLAEADLQQVANETVTISAAVIEPATPVEPEVTAEAGLDSLVAAPGTTITIAPSTSTQIAKTDTPAPIRLAALDFDTRGIAIDGNEGGLRLAGRVVTADNDSDRAILEAIDPSLLGAELAVGDAALAAAPMEPKELNKAIQAELQRLGCYQMRVDGDWGKGSRNALASYFLSKKILPTSFDPSTELFASLKADTKVVCAARYASTAKSYERRVVAKAAAAATQAKVTKGPARLSQTTSGNGNRIPETGKEKTLKSLRGMGGTN